MLILLAVMVVIAVAGRVALRRIDAKARAAAMRRHPSYRAQVAVGVDPFAHHRPGCGCYHHR